MAAATNTVVVVTTTTTATSTAAAAATATTTVAATTTPTVATTTTTDNIFTLKNKNGARPGIEPGTSRTRSANHTPRPTSQLAIRNNLFVRIRSEVT